MGAPTDENAIVATALDYVAGWYDGDVARMERTFHPELCKRGFRADATGKKCINSLSAREMIDDTGLYTKAFHALSDTQERIGKDQRPADLDITIQVEDVHGDIANATVHTTVISSTCNSCIRRWMEIQTGASKGDHNQQRSRWIKQRSSRR